MYHSIKFLITKRFSLSLPMALASRLPLLAIVLSVEGGGATRSIRAIDPVSSGIPVPIGMLYAVAGWKRCDTRRKCDRTIRHIDKPDKRHIVFHPHNRYHYVVVPGTWSFFPA